MCTEKNAAGVWVQYVFGSTRDPYSSYVSLWSYGRLGKGGFHEQVVGVDYGKDDPESFQK